MCGRIAALAAAAWIPCALAAAELGGGDSRVDELLERIAAAEAETLERLGDYEPFMETYLQAADEQAGEIDVDDHYLFGRVRAVDGDVEWTSFSISEAFFPKKRSFFAALGKKAFEPEAFARMIAPDPAGLGRDWYAYEFLRREFLGAVRTLVFNVQPLRGDEGFVGRIWVEDHGYRIVRFNGSHSAGRRKGETLHFDSWRTEVEPGFWAPSFVYVQDESPDGQFGARFKAQARVWNYSPSATTPLDELTAILVESDWQVQEQDPKEVVTPLESRRRWRREAQSNVLQRLERAGLLAPRGEVDEVLDQVVQNLIATNGLSLDVECRVLLTTPLETFSIGQAIVISRGLIDVLPDEAALAAVLSDELAHIALGHPMETLYGFSDYTLFEDIDILDRLRLRRSPDEIAAASAKADELLQASPYAEKLAAAGLFLKALRVHAPRLPNLIEGNFGNELAWEAGLLRLASLAELGPELEEGNLDQIAALPLGSRIALNPWSNEIRLLPARPAALRTARDKLPFEVTPFMPHLERARVSAQKR